MYRSILLCAMLIATSALHAQSAIPVRGTITGLQGDVLSVTTREGRDLKIELTKDTSVSYVKNVKLEDLKPGTPLGTTAVAGPDGKLVAREVHVSATGAFRTQGHFPMSVFPGATMTNGTVSAAATLSGGRELTVTYEGGSKVVLIPPNTPVVVPVAADRSYLKNGEYVALSAAMNNDGKLATSRVQVSKDGVQPPAL